MKTNLKHAMMNKKGNKMDIFAASLTVCTLLNDLFKTSASVVKTEDGTCNLKVTSETFKGLSGSERMEFVKNVVNKSNPNLLKNYSFSFTLLSPDEVNNVQQVSFKKEYWASEQEFLVNLA